LTGYRCGGNGYRRIGDQGRILLFVKTGIHRLDPVTCVSDKYWLGIIGGLGESVFPEIALIKDQ
jgi:hypothetical protein